MENVPFKDNSPVMNDLTQLDGYEITSGDLKRQLKRINY